MSDRRAVFRFAGGAGGPVAEELVSILTSGPTPFTVTDAGARGAPVDPEAPAAARLFLAAVPELAAGADDAALHFPELRPEQGPALVVLTIGATPGESPEHAAARLAEAAAAERPWAAVVVACGATPAFLDLLAQTLSGGPERGADIRLGEVKRALLTGASATGTGLALAVRGEIDEALLLRRAAAPASRSTDPDALLGTRIAGRYEIVARLGAGGMGVVYRARQLGMDREVAVKVLATALAADERALARFRREAKLLSRLRHPNLVVVHEFGVTDDGLAFIAMEMLEGHALSDLLTDGEPLPVDRAVALIDQVCAALEAAHRQGIIHRDLKPENLFVERLPDRADLLRVLDFGLARSNEGGSVLTMEGAVMGTPAYMAPEQIRGEHNDTYTDLYQLGAVMYHLFSGRRPFSGPTPLSVMMQHLSAEPPALATLRPELPSALSQLVGELLRKAPSERPQSVGDVRARLSRLGAPPAESLAPSPSVPRSPQRGRALAISGAGALVLAVAGYFATRSGDPAPVPVSAVVAPAALAVPPPASSAPSAEPRIEPVVAPPSAPVSVQTPVAAPASRSARRAPAAESAPQSSPKRPADPSVDEALDREISGMTR